MLKCIGYRKELRRRGWISTAVQIASALSDLELLPAGRLTGIDSRLPDLGGVKTDLNVLADIALSGR